MGDDHLLVLDCLTALIHLLWSDLCAILTRCALGFEEDRCQSSNRSCRSEIEDHANNGEIFLILFDIRKSTFDQISIWATRGLSSVWCIDHNTSNYHNYEKHEITVEGILEYSASIAAWLSWECLRPNNGGQVAWQVHPGLIAQTEPGSFGKTAPSETQPDENLNKWNSES